MIGGAPIYMPAPAVPGTPFLPPAPRPAVPAAAPRPSVVRGVSGREPPARSAPRVASAPLTIPTPEELGIAPRRGRSPAATSAPAARPAEVNWSVVRRSLQEMGATGFKLDFLPAGRARFSVWLPGGAGQRLVQADGDTEAVAVRDCLARARGQLVAGR